VTEYTREERFVIGNNWHGRSWSTILDDNYDDRRIRENTFV